MSHHKHAISFTGHRPQGLGPEGNKKPGEGSKLEQATLGAILDYARQGYDIFYTGCACGADLICAEAVLSARETDPLDLRLVCVVPFVGQERSWSNDWQTRYANVLSCADETIYLSDRYFRGCYHQRNRYLVDHADLMIALYNGSDKGGTAYTLHYAHQQGKEILIIDPTSLGKTYIPAAANPYGR